jgi:hypothetical protein
MLQQLRGLARLIGQSLTSRRDKHPIDTLEELHTFVSTRASFVTQKKLYGYLKERIGTRWPQMFEDDVFQTSIKVATVQVFAAGLSDLTIFCVARTLEDSDVPDSRKAALARSVFKSGLRDNQHATDAPGFDSGELTRAFEERLEITDWNFGAVRPENFTRSPAALLKWAPIADRFKKFDAEIVENSMRFAWIDIRREFSERIVAKPIIAELDQRRELD